MMFSQYSLTGHMKKGDVFSPQEQVRGLFITVHLAEKVIRLIEGPFMSQHDVDIDPILP